MRVHVGSDHAGYDLKTVIVRKLRDWGHEPVDHGPEHFVNTDDYPPYILRTAEAVRDDPGSLGIVLGGSGNGEQMAANKVAGIRAALVWSVATARLAREHNDANVLSLGARQYPHAEALAFVEAFLDTPFSGDERHVRRLDMVSRYEDQGIVPE